MTENLYGRLKVRFPILREQRHHLMFAQRIVVACAVLHNIAAKLNDEVNPITADDPLQRPYEEAVQMAPRNLPVPVALPPAAAPALQNGKEKRFAYVSEFARREGLPVPVRR